MIPERIYAVSGGMMFTEEKKKRFLYGFTAVMVLGALLFVCSGVLFPFLLGFFLAYLYQPILRGATKRGIPLVLAALFMTIITYVLIIAFILIIIPFLKQFLLFFSEYLVSSQEKLWTMAQSKVANFFTRLGPHMQDSIDKLYPEVIHWLVTHFIAFVKNGLAIAKVAFPLLLAPMIAFYFMQDWTKIGARLFYLVPFSWRGTVLQLQEEVNRSLSAYLRGQSMVCLLLAAYFILALNGIQLPSASAVGFLTGMLIFIPYVGFFTGMVTALCLSLSHIDTIQHFMVTVAIYGVGYLLEAFILTPKCIGNRTGLHPLWVLFFIFTGGSLMGVLGVLLALPVATLVAVFWRFMRARYLQTKFYQQQPFSLLPERPSNGEKKD